MSTTVFSPVETEVSLDLDPVVGEPSTAKVSVVATQPGTRVSNSVSFHLSANADERDVWVNISHHTYTRFRGLEDAITTHGDIVSHRFTEAEARALLATLANELAKLD